MSLQEIRHEKLVSLVNGFIFIQQRNVHILDLRWSDNQTLRVHLQTASEDDLFHPVANNKYDFPIEFSLPKSMHERDLAMAIAREIIKWDDARLANDLGALAARRLRVESLVPADASTGEDAAIDHLHDELRKRAETAEAEVARLKKLLERDHTGLAAALNACMLAAQSRWWIVEGRGSYEWNDDRYRKETAKALQEIVEIARKALAASGKLVDSAFRPRTTCRRCSDCEGQDHHWQDGIFDDQDNYACKHCDATAPACSTCGGIVLPHCIDPDCESHEEIS